MYEINENVFINLNNVSQLVEANDKYWVYMISGERFEVSQEVYEELQNSI